MNIVSPILLIGIGGAGTQIARGVSRAFGDNLRYTLADTDAMTGQGGGDFTLLGGDRLAGRGAGGDIVTARLAAEDSMQYLDAKLEGVRLAVVVTALGGGTGGGATLEAAKHLAELSIPTIVFATTPFSFEGEDRARNARGVMSMIEESANATFFLPLDKLVGNTDNMQEAMRHAIDTVASGVTLFWRLVEKPGYLKIDVDRLRHLLGSAGRGRFATITTQGPERAKEAVNLILSSEMLSLSTNPARTILCGVLAGDDLRLSELGYIADNVRKSFGEQASFDLGTVNDEATFSGRISVVAMIFEANGRNSVNKTNNSNSSSGRRTTKTKGALSIGPMGRGRFTNAEQTIWNGEDLDVPTFIRRNVSLEL